MSSGGGSDLMGALRFFLPSAVIGTGLFYLGRHLERSSYARERERDLARARDDVQADVQAAGGAASPNPNPSPVAGAPPAVAPAGVADQKGNRQRRQKPGASSDEKRAAGGDANAPQRTITAAAAAPKPLRRVVCAETMAWLNVQSTPLSSRCAHVAPTEPTPLAADGKKKSKPTAGAAATDAAAVADATPEPTPAPVPLVPWSCAEIDAAAGGELPAAIITSIPDVCETGMSLPNWKRWFTEVSGVMMRKVAPGSVCIFYQTDIKRDGVWVDKAHLIQTAADAITASDTLPGGGGGMHLLWHKIVICNQVNTIKGKVASYSHMLCFSKNRRSDGRVLAPPVPRAIASASAPSAAAGGGDTKIDTKTDSKLERAARGKPKSTPAPAAAASASGAASTAAASNSGDAKSSKKAANSNAPRVQATADLIAARGRMTWVRAMGLHACYQACKYITTACPDIRVIIDPFCGRGSVLAVANDFGLHAIGVDWSPKRCRAAETLVTSSEDYEALSEVEIKNKHPKQPKAERVRKSNANAATAAAATAASSAAADDDGDDDDAGGDD